MNLIVRKVWGSVLSRSCSTSRAPPSEFSPEQQSSSIGLFEHLPTDVIMQIVRLLGPRDAARAGGVCRTWRLLVSDNWLWIYFLQNGKEPWESVVFAETHLRSGLSSLMYFDHVAQLSFMHVYARREKVPGCVIIDDYAGCPTTRKHKKQGLISLFSIEAEYRAMSSTAKEIVHLQYLLYDLGGSGYCKYGWSKYSSPSGRCATFLEFGNIESPMYSRLRHFFSTIYSRMQVKPSSQPIVVSIPICYSDDTESARASRKQLKEAIYSVLFDMNAPAVCAVDQAVLALYAAKRTSGIVVNIGFHVTSIVPILHGKVMREVGVEIVGQGALKLTGFLRELLQRRNVNFESLYTVRAIKEKLCYVAADYDAELSKDTQASCEVAGDGLFTLSKERFQTAEILFQPHIGGTRTMGLHRAVAHCMDHCVAAEEVSDDGWYKTVVLAGGTSCLPGLPERLEKELHKLLPSSMSEGIKVIPPPYVADSAWFGAKIVSNVSTFSDAWCVTKKQFRQKSRRNASSFMGSW